MVVFTDEEQSWVAVRKDPNLPFKQALIVGAIQAASHLGPNDPDLLKFVDYARGLNAPTVDEILHAREALLQLHAGIRTKRRT